MDKLITLIVPVYNIENFITPCLQSLTNQTYKNIEIILVDDGSTDNSALICDTAALNDDRIKVLHKENGGLSSARNAGLKIATGNYIMFVDGDDYLALNAVEILVHLIDEISVDFIQFDYIETDKEYSPSFDYDLIYPEIITDTKTLFHKLYDIGGSAASACTKFYKKELFDDLTFKEGIIHEDEYFTSRLLQKCQSVMYINNKLYFYIMRQNSIIKSNFSPKKFDSLFVSVDRMFQLENLGCFDLLEKEKARYFLTAISLWCSAKASKNKSYLKEASEQIKFIINRPVELTGKFKMLYMLCKINTDLLFIYYIYKKITKQI